MMYIVHVCLIQANETGLPEEDVKNIVIDVIDTFSCIITMTMCVYHVKIRSYIYVLSASSGQLLNIRPAVSF